MKAGFATDTAGATDALDGAWAEAEAAAATLLGALSGACVASLDPTGTRLARVAPSKPGRSFRLTHGESYLQQNALDGADC